jgi:hypothetical protein
MADGVVNKVLGLVVVVAVEVSDECGKSLEGVRRS